MNWSADVVRESHIGDREVRPLLELGLPSRYLKPREGTVLPPKGQNSKKEGESGVLGQEIVRGPYRSESRKSKS